jgi:SAM-dependent methyltransferase
MQNSKKLNLGCGMKKKEGFINLDQNPNCQPDILHDLNIFPYPFPDNQFEEIHLDHVLEHLENPLVVLEEIFRISKDNGLVTVKCPHFSCNWLHPGHRSAISTYLFDFFDENHPERFGAARFEVKKISLFWIRHREDALCGRSLFVKAMNRIINFLANLKPSVTERVWCYWVGGFEEIVFEVIVRKDKS